MFVNSRLPYLHLCWFVLWMTTWRRRSIRNLSRASLKWFFFHTVSCLLGFDFFNGNNLSNYSLGFGFRKFLLDCFEFRCRPGDAGPAYRLDSEHSGDTYRECN
jgi:hypothetical protein